MKMNWYILQAQGNRENKVADLLKEQAIDDGVEEFLEEVIVPEEEIIENSIHGKKKTIKRRFYPGYVFIKADLSDEFMISVKKIRFARGFIGGNSPAPMSSGEIDKVKKLMNDGASFDRPVYKINFSVGEEVRINSGPFEGFTGIVKSANYEKNVIEVDVRVFGRDTSIGIDFADVSK
jgi:transcriptional antiterminator NusG